MKDQFVTKKILNWYDLNKRSLPWRKNVSSTKKQYFTLVSEFMLQQTQVVTVIPYFNNFTKKFKTKVVKFPIIDYDPFYNINNLENLKEARKIYKNYFKGEQ